MLEKVDHVLKKLVARLGDCEENHYIICMTGDHTTPCSK